MVISLSKLVPIPLEDNFSKRSSAIWNQEIAFQQSEWIKVKAPSGTGKTTFIHTLFKLRHDYKGQVCFDGQDIKTLTGDQLAKIRQTKLSIIFQDLRLFPSLSARENIELKRVLQTPYYETEMIDQMAEILGIAHILHQKAGLCSYGEQQRVAIIRALIQPFEWLLMDEPFSHLDQENIRKAASLIASECNKRKAGFILMDLDEDDHFNYSNKILL